jgi:hypothetical protein
MVRNEKIEKTKVRTIKHKYKHQQQTSNKHKKHRQHRKTTKEIIGNIGKHIKIKKTTIIRKIKHTQRKHNRKR